MWIRCPLCQAAQNIGDSRQGAVILCQECKRKIRVPIATAGAPAGRRNGGQARASVAAVPRPADDELDIEIVDEPEVDLVEETVGATGGRPGRQAAGEADEDDDAPRPKKKKKKKRKSGGLSGGHVALIVVGVVLVLGATGLFFWIQHGGSSKEAFDPQQVIAELESLHAVIERDRTSPAQPVIGLNLQDCDFKPVLLRKLTAFPSLRRLSLAGTKTSNLHLDHLEGVTSLHVLNLANTKVTGAGMHHLAKMVELEELNVAQTMVTDPSLMELKGLPLKKLNVVGSFASGRELEAAIPGLQVIR